MPDIPGLPIDPLLPEDDFYERGRKTAANIATHAQNGLRTLAPDQMASAGPIGAAVGSMLTPTSTYEKRFGLGGNDSIGWRGGIRDALVRTAGVADRIGMGIPSWGVRDEHVVLPGPPLPSNVTPRLPGVSGTMVPRVPGPNDEYDEAMRRSGAGSMGVRG